MTYYLTCTECHLVIDCRVDLGCTALLTADEKTVLAFLKQARKLFVSMDGGIDQIHMHDFTEAIGSAELVILARPARRQLKEEGGQ